jgi:YD repeat-containing protein
LLTRTITSSPSAAPSISGDVVTKTLTPRGTWSYTIKSSGEGQIGAAPSTTRTWSYTYNGVGEVLTATDPLGNKTTYAYDASGNLVSITNALGQVTLLSNYDANGRPRAIQEPNGLVYQDSQGKFVHSATVNANATSGIVVTGKGGITPAPVTTSAQDGFPRPYSTIKYYTKPCQCQQDYNHYTYNNSQGGFGPLQVN